ncbi:hypothetical protein P171DRAFT_183195 [Karstenula rhodostoma CBS 690.94]|uniref:Uncharacterized protein n=1 Tax=Karstenula rhodostoma CBS 690.94 TaxID=1392251 RepID=A0A9P4P353_9PLEO|nr:hypothetical protein P171DRAFT_183195 [Karstenula rhodostoma CBS 690.94]
MNLHAYASATCAMTARLSFGTIDVSEQKPMVEKEVWASCGSRAGFRYTEVLSSESAMQEKNHHQLKPETAQGLSSNLGALSCSVDFHFDSLAKHSPQKFVCNTLRSSYKLLPRHVMDISCSVAESASHHQPVSLCSRAVFSCSLKFLYQSLMHVMPPQCPYQEAAGSASCGFDNIHEVQLDHNQNHARLPILLRYRLCGVNIGWTFSDIRPL